MPSSIFSTVVATVLTVYGIETKEIKVRAKSDELQQYLPFTVLKLLDYHIA